MSVRMTVKMRVKNLLLSPPRKLSNDKQNSTQNESQKPLSKTAHRDVKVRQFAADHPEFTHVKLTARFHVSVSTIARARAVQKTSEIKQPEDGSMNDIPSQNGHHNERDRDTDELVQVNIDKRELAGLAHQN